MKVLHISAFGENYLYPNGVNSVEEFKSFLENYESKFLPLRRLFEKNCVSPYYILEEIKEVFVSVAHIDEFFEQEVVVLDREQYEKMLENIKNNLCASCEDRGECLSSKREVYREKICLDGTCDEFCEEDE